MDIVTPSYNASVGGSLHIRGREAYQGHNLNDANKA